MVTSMKTMSRIGQVVVIDDLADLVAVLLDVARRRVGRDEPDGGDASQSRRKASARAS